jgi:hypothetical protein
MKAMMGTAAGMVTSPAQAMGMAAVVEPHAVSCPGLSARSMLGTWAADQQRSQDGSFLLLMRDGAFIPHDERTADLKAHLDPL